MRLLSSLASADLAGKRVVVRAPLNVPIKDGDTKQKFRIASLKRTVDFLCDAGAHVALLGHLGRPRKACEQQRAQSGKEEGDEAISESAHAGAYYTRELSMAQLTDDIARILGRSVVFADACTGEHVRDILDGSAAGSLVLLENVRFYRGETADDTAERMAFARDIARNFDIYVNDAFSVSHRMHASVVELACVLPSYAGEQLAQEVATLSRVRTAPEHPAVAVIGGAKIATKLPFIRALEPLYDTILVGGKIANEAIDENISFSERVVLPTDFVGDRFDIGPATCDVFVEHIMRARTVIWNGPMGWYEKDEYARGTERIVKALTQTDAFTVVGGGESLEALEYYDAVDAIDFVSTGGGALLEFMAGKTLPGIAVLDA